jgi:hypothetical protein
MGGRSIGTTANSLSATIQITPLNLDGLPDASVGFLMNANAIIANYNMMSATVPVDENLVTIQSSWAQKSKKTLEKSVRKAAAQLQAVQAEASATTTTANPSPAP